jgi:hypothetical protein
LRSPGIAAAFTFDTLDFANSFSVRLQIASGFVQLSVQQWILFSRLEAQLLKISIGIF